MSDQPLVEVENLNVDFPLGRSLLGKPPMLRAVNDVSLKIMPQTFFGLVGESGSGKTTLGRAMLRAAPITSGTISFNHGNIKYCLLYTSPSPRDLSTSRMPSSA